MSKCNYNLKPETIRLLKRATLVLCALYAVAVLLFYGAGTLLDYQTALILSEALSVGLRGGVGLLCLGFLIMECK